MENNKEKQIDQYDAFICYSRDDIKFASAVEKVLEKYRPPKDLDVPYRYLNVFRDETDLTGPEYYKAIDNHLQNAAKLIVLCSPNARQSDYVNDEIQRFAKIKGPDDIIPVIIDGIPNNEVKTGQESNMAFPEALSDLMEVPLAVDYRKFVIEKDKIKKGNFENSWFTLLANIYGVRRSEIEQRDRNRALRRRNIAVGIIFVVMLALLLLSGWALWERQIAENQRQIALSRMLAMEALETDDPDLSIRLSLEALRVRDTVGARRSLLQSVSLYKGLKAFSFMCCTDGTPSAIAFTEDGKGLFSGDAKGNLLRWDLASEKSSGLYGSLEGEVLLIRDTNRGMRLIAVSTRQASLFDLAANPPKQETIDFPFAEISSSALSPDENHLAVGDIKGSIAVMDLREKKWSTPMTDPKLKEAVISLAFHPTKDELAASYNIPPVKGFKHPIVLWDIKSGSRVDPPFVGHLAEVTSLSFSPDGKQLASGSWDQDVRLWDTETRQMIPPVLVKAAQGDVNIWESLGPTRVAFRAPDGKMLISLMGSKVSLWDTASHKSLGLLGGIITGTAIAYSPDGMTVAIAGEGKNIVLVQTDFNHWLRAACYSTPRPFTQEEVRYYLLESEDRHMAAKDPCLDIN